MGNDTNVNLNDKIRVVALRVTRYIKCYGDLCYISVWLDLYADWSFEYNCALKNKKLFFSLLLNCLFGANMTFHCTITTGKVERLNTSTCIL